MLLGHPNSIGLAIEQGVAWALRGSGVSTSGTRHSLWTKKLHPGSAAGSFDPAGASGKRPVVLVEGEGIW